MKKVLISSVISSLILLSNGLQAEDNTGYQIPVIEHANIFAQFTDRLPAVVNYFSDDSEQAIISFYQNSYGEVITQERKRGRLTLLFTHNSMNIRVVISQQNKKRQVDVLMTNNTAS